MGVVGVDGAVLSAAAELEHSGKSAVGRVKASGKVEESHTNSVSGFWGVLLCSVGDVMFHEYLPTTTWGKREKWRIWWLGHNTFFYFVDENREVVVVVVVVPAVPPANEKDTLEPDGVLVLKIITGTHANKQKMNEWLWYKSLDQKAWSSPFHRRGYKVKQKDWLRTTSDTNSKWNLRKCLK